MARVTKTLCAMTILMALTGVGGSYQAKKPAKAPEDFVDQPLRLPFLKGYQVKDCEMKWLMGANRWYIVLQKKGKYSHEAEMAKAVLPKGHWLIRPGIEWFTGKINGKRISMMFSNGRAEADTVEAVKTDYPDTGYAMCFIDIEG